MLTPIAAPPNKATKPSAAATISTNLRNCLNPFSVKTFLNVLVLRPILYPHAASFLPKFSEYTGPYVKVLKQKSPVGLGLPAASKLLLDVHAAHITPLPLTRR